MGTVKSYTDIEQSKKLAEILPIESADMYFEPSVGFCTEPSEVRVGDIKYAHPRSVPCWSLAALLELMPLINHDTVNVFKEEDGTYTALYRYTNGSPVIIKKESAIDAAFEMVCWLKKEEYI